MDYLSTAIIDLSSHQLELDSESKRISVDLDVLRRLARAHANAVLAMQEMNLIWEQNRELIGPLVKSYPDYLPGFDAFVAEFSAIFNGDELKADIQAVFSIEHRAFQVDVTLSNEHWFRVQLTKRDALDLSEALKLLSIEDLKSRLEKEFTRDKATKSSTV